MTRVVPLQHPSGPPTSEAQLLQRAQALSGHTLGELAAALELPIHSAPVRTKGLAGRLVERMLGAHARGPEQPDFPDLGIELKTIPLDAKGRPRESTFICSIPLERIAENRFEESRAYRKLRRVLWVPVEHAPTLALGARRLGRPKLWSPDPAQLALLAADWDEVAAIIGRGDLPALTARVGQALQARPKAANARVRVRGRDENGAPLAVLPRGFYLRARFTQAIFAGQAP